MVYFVFINNLFSLKRILVLNEPTEIFAKKDITS